MKRFASTLALTLAALALPAAAMHEPAEPSPAAAAPGRRVLASDLKSSFRAGDLAFSGNVWVSIEKDQLSFQITGLCIVNYRSTPAYDVNVEVWASKQVPSVGGNTTHLTGGSFYIGTVPGGSSRCQDSGTLPATPPPPDNYWVSLALFEGMGPSKSLQALHTFAEQIDSGGPFYDDGPAIYFEKPVSAYLTNDGYTASVQVGRIRNTTSTATRRLRLGLRASTDPPRYGHTISGWTIASREYNPLNAYSYYSNVDTGSLAVAPPPAGTYWITAMLWQLGTDGVWYYDCLYTFPTPYTFTGAPPAPVADFGFSPTAPVAGQTVSFSDLSTGSPTSWLWEFGDGGTSTLRNPTHAFAAAGSYSVRLTAANASGSSSKVRSVAVGAVAAPVVNSFFAMPAAVLPGERTVLTWTSTGGTSAFIDQGVGPVPTSGSASISPVVGSPYTLTVVGPGGTATAKVTVAAAPGSWAGTWLLPSSARTSGANAFWTTDLTVTNAGDTAATVSLKFLGHEGNGGAGPERSYPIAARATLTWPDVLSLVFGRERDWGPILVRSTTTSLSVQGQTWTASPTGGTYGQSVPALAAAETVGAAPKALAGIRQDSLFRTNVVLANLKETEASVTIVALLPDGTTATTWTRTVGPLGFVQVNLQNDLGLASFAGGSLLVSSSTPGAQIAAYASVIDASTADPRTVLAR